MHTSKLFSVWTAVCLFTWVGCSQTKSPEFQQMLKAATSGNAEAKYELAIMYTNADGVYETMHEQPSGSTSRRSRDTWERRTNLAQATGLASLSLETSPRQLIGFAKQQNKVMPQLNLT